MKLVGDTAPPYPDVTKFPMPGSYLKPAYSPRSGKHYVIVGFPASKSVVDSRDRTTLVTAYAYRSDPVDDKEYQAHGLDPMTHILLPLNLKKGFDSEGRLVHFPKPQGMSGSPIIALYGEPGTEQDSRVFPVVAVGTRYRRKTKVLIGTEISFAMGAIQRFMAGTSLEVPGSSNDWPA
jgi:hypothetical protein